MNAERGTMNGDLQGGFSFMFIVHHTSFIV